MQLFHVASTDDRDSIRKNGIDYQLAEAVTFGQERHPGNYLWDTIGDAFSFACYRLDMDGDETDIWSVSSNKLTLHPDPYYETNSSVEEIESLRGSAWLTLDRIESNALALLYPGAPFPAGYNGDGEFERPEQLVG